MWSTRTMVDRLRGPWLSIGHWPGQQLAEQSKMRSLASALRGKGSSRRPAAFPSTKARLRGQALAEFALVIPLLAFVIAGIIQFGLIFWSQQTLTQVARDAGRWAATQACDANVVSQANEVAKQSTLFGYTAGSWNASNISVAYSDPANCPPEDNSEVVWVEITLNHQIPIFFPWVPGNGNLSTTAEFRMEPMAS